MFLILIRNNWPDFFWLIDSGSHVKVFTYQKPNIYNLKLWFMRGIEKKLYRIKAAWEKYQKFIRSIITPWMVLLNKSSGNKKDRDGQTLKSSSCPMFGRLLYMVEKCWAKSWQITSDQVIFVVDTVITYYCVYYKYYLNECYTKWVPYRLLIHAYK